MVKLSYLNKLGSIGIKLILYAPQIHSQLQGRTHFEIIIKCYHQFIILIVINMISTENVQTKKKVYIANEDLPVTRMGI